MRGRIAKREIEAAQSNVRSSGKPAFLWDTRVKGFAARVAPTGSVSFLFEYRLGGRKGRNQRLSIGKLGDLTPDQARREAEALRGQVLKGIDVALARKRLREGHHVTESFAQVAERYLALNGRDNVSWGETRRIIEHDATHAFRGQSFKTISRTDVARLIDAVTTRAPATGRALFAALRPLFRWAFERELIEANPFVGLRAPAASRARERVLTIPEIRGLWRAASEFGYPFGPIWQLLLLTGQRLEEVSGMKWAEIDSAAGLWHIPGRIVDTEGRKVRGTKNGLPHVVDLSPQALEILNGCLRHETDLVFTTTGKTAVSGFSKAKARLDRVMVTRLGPENEPWRNHDIRRTVSTKMAEELGIDEGVIERIHNRRQQGDKGTYQRQEYRKRRRAALLGWSEFVVATAHF
jgi:integrase